ncbi:MAG TPA: HAMP domain-containing sensor histidine kinase [Candidatus Thermoplasmatota archaeon]|nr:HAMP domain-containing sensor histidine kinase [Candidatus Thermoplasmatota archaeon]
MTKEAHAPPQELAAVVHRNLRPVAGALAVVYAMVAAANLLLADVPPWLLLTWLTAAAAYGLASSLTPSIPQRAAHAAMAALTGAALGLTAVLHAVAPDLVLSGVTLLLVLGAGMLYLSFAWYAATAAAAIAAWGWILARGHPVEAWLPWFVMLLSATGLGAAAILARRQTLLALFRSRNAVAEHEQRASRQEVDAFKATFVNHCAHELATPLTPVVLQTAVLKARALERADDGLLQAASLLERNVAQLQQVVNDILFVSRQQGGTLPVVRRSTSVRNVLLSVADALGSEARRSGVGFEVDAPDVTVEADPDRLLDVVRRLATNALRSSPPGARVQLTASVDGGVVRFAVQDEGPPVPEEARGRLFEGFSGIAAAGNHPAGAGLGLHLARLLVEAQGGRIWHEPLPKGSRFCFELPRRAAAAAPQAVAKARSA